MLADWLHRPPKMRCIGAATGLGGARPGCEQGPAVLWKYGLPQLLWKNAWEISWDLLAPENAGPDERLGPMLHQLAACVSQAISTGEFPLILGGDHSIAAGTWRGVGRALGQAPGLLWFDAHLDAHVPETSPSGNLHGMPVAALLGIGSPVLTDIPGPVLDPASVVLIGVRSYESAEWEYMQRRGVRVVTMGEIAERGLEEVVAEALAIISRHGPWGISLDVDVLDPSVAGAVSTPAPSGLEARLLMHVLQGILRAPGCCAFELAEFNPLLDNYGETAAALLDLMDAISAPVGSDWNAWQGS